jgi:hypothetical protein
LIDIAADSVLRFSGITSASHASNAIRLSGFDIIDNHNEEADIQMNGNGSISLKAHRYIDINNISKNTFGPLLIEATGVNAGSPAAAIGLGLNGVRGIEFSKLYAAYAAIAAPNTAYLYIADGRVTRTAFIEAKNIIGRVGDNDITGINYDSWTNSNTNTSAFKLTNAVLPGARSWDFDISETPNEGSSNVMAFSLIVDFTTGIPRFVPNALSITFDQNRYSYANLTINQIRLLDNAAAGQQALNMLDQSMMSINARILSLHQQNTKLLNDKAAVSRASITALDQGTFNIGYIRVMNELNSGLQNAMTPVNNALSSARTTINTAVNTIGSVLDANSVRTLFESSLRPAEGLFNASSLRAQSLYEALVADIANIARLRQARFVAEASRLAPPSVITVNAISPLSVPSLSSAIVSAPAKPLSVSVPVATESAASSSSTAQTQTSAASSEVSTSSGTTAAVTTAASSASPASGGATAATAATAAPAAASSTSPASGGAKSTPATRAVTNNPNSGTTTPSIVQSAKSTTPTPAVAPATTPAPAPQGVTAAVQNTVQAAATTVRETAQKVTAAVQNTVQNVRNAANNAVQNVRNTLSRLFPNLVPAP